MATNLIVLAAHQAYELDIILLTKYRFLQRINEIRKGPIGGRNEKAVRLPHSSSLFVISY